LSLHYRQRGEVWHVRGTVRVGRQTIKVSEHSTGCRARRDAESAGEGEANKIRHEILDGRPLQRRHTITEAIHAYTHRPKSVPEYDLARLQDFMERIGEYAVADAGEAWGVWLTTRGAAMAPATAARSRAILQAALNYGSTALGFPPMRLPTVAQRAVDGVVYLTRAEQERMLAAYTRWAWPVVLTLCYQGLRSQEALRMDWRHVSLERGTIHIPAEGAKSGKGRTVPMHPRVRWALAMLAHGRRGAHAAQPLPTSGAVFLSHRGKPYADTRGLGGNPLARAHATACARAGLTGFRVHDWRHHWASHMVMSGCDLTTLMRLGGWATPRMVQRYAAVSGEHMAAAIGRLQ
jgi:integrase